LTAHALSHVPQCAALDCRLTHSPEQSVKPWLQSIPHTPLTHVALPPSGAEHVTPQPPQCCVLFEVFTHWPLQA
jgi:hypothetical protein